MPRSPAEICTREARTRRVAWYLPKAAAKSPSASSARAARQSASSSAMAAPCAKYCSMKCAASPSSVPGPQRRGRPAQVFRHLVDLEHRAVAHVPRDRRLAVADDAAADHRAAAVRADQGGGGNALPAGNLDCDAIALVAKASHARAGAQLDRALLPAAVEQRAVDVGAVRHRVRIAEALREARVERDVDHRLAANPVHHQQVLDEHGLLLHPLADAKRIDGVPGIRRELDAGADLAELGRLLEHDDPEVAPRQRERHGEAADTAPGDDYWPGIACCRHWNGL